MVAAQRQVCEGMACLWGLNVGLPIYSSHVGLGTIALDVPGAKRISRPLHKVDYQYHVVDSLLILCFSRIR